VIGDKTAIYRHYAIDGTLLYVGISISALARTAQHRDTSGWYGRIAIITVEWLDTRLDAEAAEAAAIMKEQPLYNVSRPFGSEVGNPALLNLEKFQQEIINNMMNEKDAAKHLGMSVKWMQQARCYGHGPKYIKIGRSVRYREEDLDAYLKYRTVAPGNANYGGLRAANN